MAENCISRTCVRLLGSLRVLLFSGPTAAGIAQRMCYHLRVYLLSFERLSKRESNVRRPVIYETACMFLFLLQLNEKQPL